MPERGLWHLYKLRLRRKRLLWRAFTKRTEFQSLIRRTDAIRPGDVLLFSTVRDEALRLPFFLSHYRRLGVRHFLFMDNGSNDDTVALLQDQPDVSLWQANASYRASRFGLDWLTALLWRYGHGHWTLTVDADELFIYPHWEDKPLPQLTNWLARQGHEKMGAVMLELYPKGSIADQTYVAGQNPVEVLPWFDAYGYWAQRQPKMDNLWLQGGPRARLFFSETPHLAPTLNKIPLVRWRKPFVYVNSTHNALPVHLNHVYDQHGIEKPSGALLHTKFLPDAPRRAGEESVRGEHFANPATYEGYYKAVAQSPDFWTPQSQHYTGWRQLLELGLMSRGGWPSD